ncbi:MAG: siderophore ABC transporter substrate-binding protein [Paracoccus sp. (in: a-proteobacteria)]
MRRFSAAMLAAVTFASAAIASDVTIATAQGEVTLPEAPEKVAAYDVAAIDTLNALGVSLAGIPDTLYLPDLSGLQGENIGTLFEPDLEKLAGVAPDLIIVGSRSAPQRDAVAQVATAIDMTIGADLVADARARIDAYGALFARPDKAEALQAALDEKLAALRAAAENKGNALIVMTNGPKMAAYGDGSRFGWIHQQTGIKPAIADLSTEDSHGNVLTHEAIAEANPDWLFVLDRGVAVGDEGESASQTLKSPLVEATNAWKNDHVVYLPAAELYIGGGGYTSLSKVVETLTEALSK